MSERDEIIERRRQLKLAYRDLYEVVSAILFRHDPMGINFETNNDEYEPEVGTILPRLASASSPADVQRIVHEELVRWFGGSTDDGVPADEWFTTVAKEIWDAWQRHVAAK